MSKADADKLRERAERIAARVAAEYLANVHMGPYPDTCVLGDPHCDCKMGQYCKRMPLPKPPKRIKPNRKGA